MDNLPAWVVTIEHRRSSNPQDRPMTSNHTHRPICTLRACLGEEMMVLPSNAGAFAAFRMRSRILCGDNRCSQPQSILVARSAVVS